MAVGTDDSSIERFYWASDSHRYVYLFTINRLCAKVSAADSHSDPRRQPIRANSGSADKHEGVDCVDGGRLLVS